MLDHCLRRCPSIKITIGLKCRVLWILIKFINPFGPEFTIFIFIHYQPQIAVAILDL